MSNWRRMLKEARALWEEGLIDDLEFEQLKDEAFRIQSSGETEEFSSSLAMLQLKMKLEDRIKKVNRLGWRIAMPEPPYHEQKLEDFIYMVEQQINYVGSCKNSWGVPHPHFPITPESFQLHKQRIAQQVEWDHKIQKMHAKTKIPKPTPPYTRATVQNYLRAGSKKRKNKNKGMAELLIGVVIFSIFYALEWQEARALERKAQQLGLNIQMPVFQRDEEIRRLYLAEKLYSQAVELEKRARLMGWNLKFDRPYDTTQVGFIAQNFEDLARVIESGIDLNELDVYSTDVKKLMFASSDTHTVAVPTGSFIMGCSADDEDCKEDEIPRHKVRITQSYEMMTSEVTQSLYQVITGKNPSYFNECGTDCPVENISWFEAAKFANELSDVFGLEPCYFIYNDEVIWKNKSCEGWRLPTEAEWEYAARGGQIERYPGNTVLSDITWFSENSDGKTHPTCQKVKNSFGLCDMSGNVAEWIWDGYDEQIYASYYKIGTVRDPIGTTNQKARKSLRGGSWSNQAVDIRVSTREAYLTTRKSGNYGFRLVRNR